MKYWPAISAFLLFVATCIAPITANARDVAHHSTASKHHATHTQKPHHSRTQTHHHVRMQTSSRSSRQKSQASPFQSCGSYEGCVMHTEPQGGNSRKVGAAPAFSTSY